MRALTKVRPIILTRAISVWRVNSTDRSYRKKVRAYAPTEIRAGEEVKQFGEIDARGDVLIRWGGRTYLARESDLTQKPAAEETE